MGENGAGKSTLMNVCLVFIKWTKEKCT
ncbi:MAG: hypothetical protein RSB57_09855 [Hungatella sp.]